MHSRRTYQLVLIQIGQFSRFKQLPLPCTKSDHKCKAVRDDILHLQLNGYAVSRPPAQRM